MLYLPRQILSFKFKKYNHNRSPPPKITTTTTTTTTTIIIIPIIPHHHHHHHHHHHNNLPSHTSPLLKFNSIAKPKKQRYQINMLPLTFLFTSLLLSFAAAQNSTLDPSSVDSTTKSLLPPFPFPLPFSLILVLTWNQDQWCTAELNNCPILCGGQTHLKSQSCDGVSPAIHYRAIASPSSMSSP